MSLEELTFYAGFDDGTSNGDFGLGNLVSSEFGTVSVSNSKLQLTDTDSYVEYEGFANIDRLVDTGAVRVVVEPQYDGSPSSTQVFFDAFKTDNNDENEIKIEHDTNGDINIQLNADDGSTLQSTNIGSFSATSGEKTELEINFNLRSDEIRFFKDGEQLGTVVGTISKGGRKGSINKFRIGTNWDATDTEPNMKIDSVAIFKEPQHRVSYTSSTQLDIDRTIIYSNISDIVAQKSLIGDLRYAYLSANVNNDIISGNDVIIPSFPVTSQYNNDGFAIMKIIETESTGDSNVTFEIVYETDNGDKESVRFRNKQVPNRDSINLVNL